MARELRHETLAPTNVTVDTNSAAEFRNDSASMIHIRGIDYAHKMITAENDESMTVEISKAPTLQSNTPNSPFFNYPQSVGITATTGAALDDSTAAVNGSKRWGRGQLTLEPNESLFVNIDVAGTPSANVLYVLEYEFA